MENKGYAIVYISWDDALPRVAARFKTEEEKDAYLEEIQKYDSGWTNEELQSVSVVNDYNYYLPF